MWHAYLHAAFCTLRWEPRNLKVGHLQVFAHVRVRASMRACVRTCACPSGDMFVHVCTRMCVFVCVCLRANGQACVHACSRLYGHVCMLACLLACVNLFVRLSVHPSFIPRMLPPFPAFPRRKQPALYPCVLVSACSRASRQACECACAR